MTKDILANFLPIAACITRTRRTAWRGQSVAPDFAHIEVRRLRVMRTWVYPEAALLAQTVFQPGSWLTSTTPQTPALTCWSMRRSPPARLQAIRRHRVYPSRNPTGQCRVPALSGTIIIRRPCGPSGAKSTSDRCRPRCRCSGAAGGWYGWRRLRSCHSVQRQRRASLGAAGRNRPGPGA